jgi:Uma2 family endonuclease
MEVAVRKPRMTRDEFFPWAQAQDARYEFDGFEPVAMTGGTANHSRITQNILFALRSRLRGGACRPSGRMPVSRRSGPPCDIPMRSSAAPKFPGMP